MRFFWQLLMVSGIAVGVAALAEYVRRQRESRGSDGGGVQPWPGEAPSAGVVGWRPAVFFDLSEPEQLWVLMELIRETGGCAEIEEEALKTGRTDRLHELLVTLLGIKDPRMDTPRADAPAADGRDAVRVERRARHRVDDSLFKDNLLYMLRDRLPADSPLIDGIVRAYDRDEEPYNRARIVRAVGLIGGARARAFLERVVSEEARYRSLASREARKFLVAP